MWPTSLALKSWAVWIVLGCVPLCSGRANRNVREAGSSGTRVKMDFPDINEAGSGANKGRGAKEVVPRIDFQERPETPDTRGKGRGVQGGRGAKVETPRIDFQERAEPPTAKPGKGRGVQTEGRGAKEVLPRIDFQERAESPAGNTAKGKGVEVKAGRGVKEVIPRIDFQERAEPPAAVKGKGMETKAGRGVKEVFPRIDFAERAEPPTTSPGKGRGVNKVPGGGTKEEIPRVDFQERQEPPSKPGTNGKGPQAGRGVQAITIAPTAPPTGSAVEMTVPHVSDGFDGKITIVMKNSKIVDISIAPELLMKLVDGSFKMTSTKEGNEPIFAIDVAKEGHDKAHYKLPGLRISANRALGDSADDERVQEGIAPTVSDLDFKPDRLPAMVVVRNKPGDEPVFYGKIEERGGHKVMTPVSPEEANSSDSTVYELIRTKTTNTSRDVNSTLS